MSDLFRISDFELRIYALFGPGSAELPSVSQRVDSNIERQFLTVFGADTFAFVTCVIRAEGATKAILAHHSHQIALVEQAFELNISRFVETADTVDLVKRAIDQMVVGDRLYSFILENAVKLPPPRFREVRVRAAARGEEKPPMTEIFPQILDFRLGQHKIVVPVHEQKGSFEQIGVRQSDFALLLYLQG